jgi:acyl-CoA synthetase (AMP-forming)/AMP-acid ligase II
VAVPSGALEGMIESIRRWLEMDGSGETVSWLPIQHDMGLIGCLLTPVVDASDVALMAPEAFLRRPSRYLERLSGGVRRSALPGFAIDTLSRTVAPADVARLDLSGWRTLVVGAQRLDPGGIERFCGLLEPAGFDRRAVLPAYGLAEATLAVTGLPLRASWSHVSVRASSLAAGRRVEPASAGEDAVDVIGCGVPLEGVGVTVTAGGAELEPGTVGEIVVRGASVASYLDGGRSPSLTTFVDGALHTGDAGFLLDGQLFVLGRFGDSVKVRGTMLFAETVEAALVALGIPPHRVVALLGNRAGVPAVVALLERPRDGDTARAEAVLRRSAGGASTQVLEVPRGTIARTSSGKPRRRELWQAFVEDRLPGA